jgi:ribonuclease HIII
VPAKSITVALPAARALAAIEAFVRDAGASLERRPLQNGERLLITGGLRAGLNLYPSKEGGCKVVFDDPASPAAEAIARALGGVPSVVKASKIAGDVGPVLADAASWVGSDESGKGDYFGPLVVGAVAVTAENWRVLETLGAQDSKALSDARAAALAADIRAGFPHAVVTIMPRRYNELWKSMGNANRMLAWAHARAIEDIAEQGVPLDAAVADQFGDESLIADALARNGRVLRLVQMPRAERDPAVAAASIIARAEFIRRLDRLSRDAGVRLPKGASSAVDAVGRALVAQRGPDVLDEVAKRHFKTTARVLRGKMID